MQTKRQKQRIDNNKKDKNNIEITSKKLKRQKQENPIKTNGRIRRDRQMKRQFG